MQSQGEQGQHGSQAVGRIGGQPPWQSRKRFPHHCFSQEEFGKELLHWRWPQTGHKYIANWPADQEEESKKEDFRSAKNSFASRNSRHKWEEEDFTQNYRPETRTAERQVTRSSRRKRKSKMQNQYDSKDLPHRVLIAQPHRVISFPPGFPRPSEIVMASEMGRVSQNQMAMAAPKNLNVTQNRMAMAASELGKASQDKMAMAASEMDKMSKRKMAMAASELGNVSQDKMAMVASEMGKMSKPQEMVFTTTRNANKFKVNVTQDMQGSRNAMTISERSKQLQVEPLIGEKPKNIPQEVAISKQVITNDWDKNGTAMMKPDGFQRHLSSKTMTLEEPYFLRLRKSLPWWEKHAPAATVKLIRQGVQPTFKLPDHLDSRGQKHSPREEAQALKVLQEYMQVGAVIKNPPGLTRHLIPWFVISKQEQGKEKLRLISDCRTINQFFKTKHFKLDHWKIFFHTSKKACGQQKST